MNRAEWRDLKLPMIWSIYDKESEDKVEALMDIKGFSHVLYERIELDLSAPEGIADGVYEVYHYKSPSFYGVTIKDGLFVPVPTVYAVLKTEYWDYRNYNFTLTDVWQGRERVHHVFIEGFKWDEERQALQVHLGS